MPGEPPGLGITAPRHRGAAVMKPGVVGVGVPAIFTWLRKAWAVIFTSNINAPGASIMTTTVTHNETVPTLVDVSTLTPGTGYASGGGTFLLLTVPQAGGSAGSALNIDTDAVVAVNAPLAVEILDLSITVTNHVVPPAAAPAGG